MLPDLAEVTPLSPVLVQSSIFRPATLAFLDAAALTADRRKFRCSGCTLTDMELCNAVVAEQCKQDGSLSFRSGRGTS